MLREIPVDFSVRDDKLNMLWQSDLSKKTWGNNEGNPIDFSDVDPKSQKKWKKTFKRALAGEMIKGEDSPLIYGTKYIFYTIVSPVFINDEVNQVTVINVDISKIKETEKELLVRNTELQKLNTELDRFVYSASHDLRAPLASILGLIDLSKRETNSPDNNQYLDLMQTSVKTMDNFITDITEYSRNLRLITEFKPVNLVDIINDSFNHLKFMGNENSNLEIDISGDHEFISDADRLRLIFNNLLSNAIRYRSPGRASIIHLKAKISKKETKITIADNGIGIRPEHLDSVFDMFYRANHTNVGSGLGLFIVKETVEKLKGSVTINSTPGEGTKIQLILPNRKK
jgi:signal transduction histidine kinase